MSSLLHDLLAHRSWADAEHVRATVAHAAAAEDRTLLARLRHMLDVQCFFLGLVGGRSTAVTWAPEVTPDITELCAALRALHADERRFVGGLDADALEERIAMPRVQDPTLVVTLTRTELLAQSAMHSQHHRAQNATRLRELGATPPTTDLIVWFWQGRPEPQWEGEA